MADTNRLVGRLVVSLAFVGLTLFVWWHMRQNRVCPVHPCDCHVEYSHCVRECPNDGATKQYSSCCRLHCLATLQQELAP